MVPGFVFCVEGDDLLGEVLDAAAQRFRFEHFDGSAEAKDAFAGVLEGLEGEFERDPALGVRHSFGGSFSHLWTEGVGQVGDESRCDARDHGVVGAALLRIRRTNFSRT